MTREILEKGNEILNEIEKVEKILEYAIRKNERTSANFLTLRESGDDGINLYLNDDLTHEILRLIIDHYIEELKDLDKSLEVL